MDRVLQVNQLSSSRTIPAGLSEFGGIGNTFHLFNANGAIHMAEKIPNDFRGPLFVREVKKHGKKEHRGKGLISLPVELVHGIGCDVGDYFSVREMERGHLTVSPATETEIKFFAPKKHTRAISGRVANAFGTMYFTQEEKDHIGITAGALVKVTVCIAGKSYIKVEPYDPIQDADLMGYRDAIQAVGKETFWSKASVYRYKLNSGAFTPPRVFVEACGIEPEDVLNVYRADNALIIEGKADSCDYCGTKLSSLDANIVTVPVCGHCAENMPLVRNIIQEHGGDYKAAAKAAIEMLKTIK